MRRQIVLAPLLLNRPVIQVFPLGGAGEVGASAALLDIDGVRLLIDAGVRVGGSLRKTGQSLPDFGAVAPASVDAMLVTHAHMDHVGAMPLALPLLREGATVHMTTPTLHLLQVLQGDSGGGGGAEHAGAEDEPRPWEGPQGDRLLSRCMPHPYHTRIQPIAHRPDVVIEFGPNGHILGSAWILIDTPAARVLWLGDYSVTPQPTIGGLDVDALVARVADRRIDLIVTEGTYGMSRHASRPEETGRFLRILEQVAARGGITLIPAFALGRAQDLVHTIRDAKLTGRLHGVPVLLDGMVQPVTQVYQNIAHHAYPHLRTPDGVPEQPLTLLDPDLGIVRASPTVRSRILKGEHDGPAVIIASSGMLIGGKSVLYAKALAGDQKHAILLSGYQDEESPGRHLMGMKRGGRLRFADGERVKVRCSFGRYQISAHADGTQIVDLITRLDARHVAFVHGEPESLSALATAVGPTARVLANSTPWSIRLRTKARPVAPGQSPVPPLGDVRPEKLARTLWERLHQLGVREYSDREVALHVFGPGYSARQLELLDQALCADRLYFQTGAKIGERTYRPRTEDELVGMMMERQVAYGQRVSSGDVVVLSDGSPELQVGIVATVDGGQLRGVVAGSDRTLIDRTWLRGASLVGEADLAAHGMHAAGAVRWLERLVREARALTPAASILRLWAWASDTGASSYTTSELMQAAGYDPLLLTAAERLAWMLALAQARGWFRLESEGRWSPRPAEAVARGSRQGAKVVAGLAMVGTRQPLQLTTGAWVTPTGEWQDGGLMTVEQGLIAWRFVLLPTETPVVPQLVMARDPQELAARQEQRAARRAKRQAKKRRAKKGKRAPTADGARPGRGADAAPERTRETAADQAPARPLDGADDPSAEKRKRRRRRRRGGRKHPRHTGGSPVVTLTVEASPYREEPL